MKAVAVDIGVPEAPVRNRKHWVPRACKIFELVLLSRPIADQLVGALKGLYLACQSRSRMNQ
ncbi:hypothetical protein D9M71_652930 [compost metagenome]